MPMTLKANQYDDTSISLSIDRGSVHHGSRRFSPLALEALLIALPYNKGKPLSLQQITDFLSKGTKQRTKLN